MAGEHNVSLCIGEDSDENVVIVPNQRGALIHILACGITKGPVMGRNQRRSKKRFPGV